MKTPLVIVTLTIIAFLLNVALVGLGIYLANYLKKKAEHLATREEFQELLTQTAELTGTTKEIEAKISDDVWNRQRRWELKRDLLLEMAKKMSAAYDALNLVHATYQSEKMAEKTGKDQSELVNLEARTRAVNNWSSASTDFDTAAYQVALVCSPELAKALQALMVYMRMTYHNTTEDPAEYLKAMPEYVMQTITIEAMIRKELGIDPDRAG